uniref:Uncharacterized protein n=1 Tax=Rhipicephalus microplus TaxID=6941 RepID=A0A6G5A0R7_RHIMP
MPLGTRAVSGHSDFCADATAMIWLLLMANCCRGVKALLHVHTPQYCYPLLQFSPFLFLKLLNMIRSMMRDSLTCEQRLSNFPTFVEMQFCGMNVTLPVAVYLGHPCTYRKLAQLTIPFFFFGIAQPRHESSQKTHH